MSKLLGIAGKTLREIFRQPRSLILGLGIPVMFMLIFGSVFGASTSTTYKIAVVNDDAGNLGAQYVAGLANLTYANGKALVVLSHPADAAAAREALTARTVDLYLHVPANFTAGLTPPTVAPNNPGPVPAVGQQPAGQRAPPPGTSVETLADPSDGSSNAAQRVVATYTERFSEAASGQSPVVKTDSAYITSGDLTQFDFIAPGLMVYSVIALAPQAAAVLARETELKTLDRVRLSPTRAGTLLGGVALAEIAMSAIAVGLMLVTARLMGFHNQGSYLSAFGICLVAALSTVGIGMVIASFARTQPEAANFGVLVSLPMSFLSGAFFAIPDVHLFDWSGHSIGLYDLLPAKHAIDAMRQVMTLGRPLSAVAFSLAAMAVLAALYFLVGVVLYSRARLAPE